MPIYALSAECGYAGNGTALRHQNRISQTLTFDKCDPDGKSLFWFFAQEVILYCLEGFSLSMCILSKLFTFF